MGFPSTIVITKASQIPDGTIKLAGGTIDDNAFRDAPPLTFPPGLVSSPTTVSIDVFASPLSVPTPRTSRICRSFRLCRRRRPPRGITVVLPPLTPMTPGALLSLYHIDPIIGLAPAMNAFGKFGGRDC